MKKTAVVLFSDDFRTIDNPALFNAALENYNVIPLFIYNEDYMGRNLGSASKVFLHFILKSFSELLESRYGSSPLIIKKGDEIEVLTDIQKKTRFEKVFLNRSYTAKQIETESKITKHFSTQTYKAKIIFEPTEIKEIKVFTPFWKECLKNSHLVGSILPEPQNLQLISTDSLNLEDLELLPKKNWWKKIYSFFELDYKKIRHQMESFFEKKIYNYKEARNMLYVDGVSRFSPYIRFGALSPRELFLKSLEKSQSFNSEIGWREFAYHTLYRNQNLASKELKPEFQNFKWDNNDDFFYKWKQGKTGERIVDAGMNELWQTGFMHNRARMITASFLIKDLLINWRAGEQWFWDCLCDACPAVNPFSWQWVFGSGYDSAPYFRVFNPVLQQEKFDPDCIYINKWNSISVQKKIVDHDIQRKEALLRYESAKNSN